MARRYPYPFTDPSHQIERLIRRELAECETDDDLKRVKGFISDLITDLQAIADALPLTVEDEAADEVPSCS